MISKKTLDHLHNELEVKCQRMETRRHHSEQASAALRLFNLTDLQGFVIQAPGHDPVYLAGIPPSAIHKFREALQLVCEHHAVMAYGVDLQPAIGFENNPS